MITCLASGPSGASSGQKEVGSVDEEKLRAVLHRMGVQVGARSRDWLIAPCPLAKWRHGRGHDHSPSFAVKINPRGISGFMCQACHAQGRVAGLARLIGEYSGQDMSAISIEADAAEMMSGNFPSYDDLPRFRMLEPMTPVDGTLWRERLDPFVLSDDAVAYLEGRGISQGTAIQIGILWDRRERRVVFPIHTRTGVLVGFSGRAVDAGVDPKIRDYAGLPKRRVVLGSHLWTRDLPVMIVEGLFGYAHLLEIGVNDQVNVGAIMGSLLTPEKASIIVELGRSVFLLLDNDPGGEAGLWGVRRPDMTWSSGAVDRLSRHVPVYVPLWPADKKDPDELTREEVSAMISDTGMYDPRR